MDGLFLKIFVSIATFEAHIGATFCCRSVALNPEGLAVCSHASFFFFFASFLQVLISSFIGSSSV